MKQSIKLQKSDHRNLRKDHQPGKQPEQITVERQISSIKLLGAIIIAPAMLAAFFWAIFIIESQGLSPRSDFVEVLAGCIWGLISEGCTKCLPDLTYIIFCSVLGGPFAGIISFKIWKSLKTKIILTDQSIIKEQPLGKDIQFDWHEIKQIEVVAGEGHAQLKFTRSEGSVFLDSSDRKFCYLILRKEKPSLSGAVARMVLNKCESYGISISGDRGFLDEFVQAAQQPLPGPVTPGMSGRNRFARKTAPAQRSTLK